jgi:hypothetical protein
MSQGLDFFLGSDVEINLRRWSGWWFLFLFPLRLAAPRTSGGVGRFYLAFESISSARIPPGGTSVEAVPRTSRRTEGEDDGEKEKRFFFTRGRHVGRL